jgi:hypothetical protein
MQTFISLYYGSMAKFPVNAPAETDHRSRRAGSEVREKSQIEKS